MAAANRLLRRRRIFGFAAGSLCADVIGKLRAGEVTGRAFVDFGQHR